MLYLRLHCIRTWRRECSEISHLIKNVLKAFVTVALLPGASSGQAGREGAVGGEGAGLAPRPAMLGPGQVPFLPLCSHTEH